MKKFLFTLLAASLCSSLQAAPKTLTFGTAAGYPPFESTNAKGELIGFDIDLAFALCQQLQRQCQFKNEAFDGLIPKLIQHRGGIQAVIAAVDITPARAKKVAFTQAYFKNAAGFLVKKSTDLHNAQKIGVQKGTTFQQYLQKNTAHKQLVPYNNIQEAAVDLSIGRVDAVFGDNLALQDLSQKDKNLTLAGKPVTDPNYFGQGFGIALPKRNKALLAELNQALNAVQQNGEYQKIYAKWFGEKK